MFTPAIPIGGFAGFKVFERSSERQLAAFSKSPEIKRDIAYFREKIAEVGSPGAILSDRRLLTVALGAFGLETEISKKAIIRRVLEQPLASSDSFVNRLNDPRWKAFARAFGFGDGPPRVELPTFRDDIAARYLERSFERAVGDVNPDIRLALNFRREARAIAAGASVERSGWFQILGQSPLRLVVQGAFNLPASVAQLDIDRQKTIFEDKSLALFGTRSPAAFRNEKNIEIALRKFFVARTIEDGAAISSRGATALVLLGGGQSPAAGLILSNART